MGAPAGRMRRPHISELTRSVSCQSGPDSIKTAFLPAFANTEAKTEPEQPAPMMTTSTFSFAISPPLVRHDVGLIRDAEGRIALHGSVDDVDRIGAQQGVDEASGWTGPAFDLVLAHAADEIVLFGGRELREFPIENLLGSAIDSADGGAIEIRERRPHIED